MTEMRISEDQMTYLLKEFLRQYQGDFTHVTFDPVPGQNGYMVNFHFGEHSIPTETSRSRDEDDIPTSVSPISIPFPDFGGGSTPSPAPDFGGFGGGASGGAGASGGW